MEKTNNTSNKKETVNKDIPINLKNKKLTNS